MLISAIILIILINCAHTKIFKIFTKKIIIIKTAITKPRNRERENNNIVCAAHGTRFRTVSLSANGFRGSMNSAHVYVLYIWRFVPPEPFFISILDGSDGIYSFTSGWVARLQRTISLTTTKHISDDELHGRGYNLITITWRLCVIYIHIRVKRSMCSVISDKQISDVSKYKIHFLRDDLISVL